MLEIKYYRDYGHNYVILQCGRQETTGSYQYKMLASGKVDELLKCSLRHINGTTYYYYDISSRTTLDNLFRDKVMSYEQVADLVRQLHGIYGKLAGYFMDAEGLVLLPEQIYYDLARKKYIGLYYPDHGDETDHVYRPLMEFLLEHIDPEDRELAEKVYAIYEMSEDEGFFIGDALRMLEDGQSRGGETPADADTESAAADAEYRGAEPRDAAYHGTEYRDAAYQGAAYRNAEYRNTRCQDAEYREAEYRETFPKKHTEVTWSGQDGWEETVRSEGRLAKRRTFSGKKFSLYHIIALGAGLGIPGAAVVRFLFVLSVRERITLYGIMAVLAVCLAYCGTMILKERRERRPSSDSDGADSPSGWEYPEPAEYGGEYGGEYGSFSCMQADAPTDWLAGGLAGDAGKEVARESEPDCGNTVFYDIGADREYKLYALDKKNKNHIELKRFPCTVGKMAGCVDYVLPDDSVSRMHARFEKKDGRILLTDMNSTNGTFKNGLRMQPQETVEIEPGDEIRFGSLNYCYR